MNKLVARLNIEYYRRKPAIEEDEIRRRGNAKAWGRRTGLHRERAMASAFDAAFWVELREVRKM